NLLVSDAREKHHPPHLSFNRWRNYYQRQPKAGNLLIKILLDEEKYREALGHARTYGCTDTLWLELADKLVATHTQAAIDIYKEQIILLIHQTNNRSYEDATTLLKKLQEFYEEYDNGEDFLL